MNGTWKEQIQAAVREDMDDWELLMRFLPPDWEAKARELGAFRRAKGFKEPRGLLRGLLIHLALGCSLKETALRCRQEGFADVSSVAVWKRLQHAGPWLQWLAEGVMRGWMPQAPGEVLGNAFRVRLVDGTAISEPGSTGSDWRIHYSVELARLNCDFVEVTDIARGGESFTRFPIRPNDLLLGDRVYATRAGIRHVVEQGGHVLVRLPLRNLPLQTLGGKPLALLARLRRLRTGEIGEWEGQMVPESKEHVPINIRICALKRSKTAATQARKRILRRAKRNGSTPRKETLESASYIFVATTAPGEKLTASQALEVYRGRWQVELAFKRLKSLMGLGHLPKKDPEGARAWLHGKLLAAFLVEAIIFASETFFPWGYPSDRH